MTSLPDRFARIVTSYPRRALAATAALVVLLGVGFVRPGLGFDADNAIWFVEGDPTLVAYEQLPERFGDNKFVVVAITTDDSAPHVFNQETFELTDEITRWFEEQYVVVSVRSLTNHERIVPSPELIDIEAIWPLPPSVSGFEELRELLVIDELVTGSLVSTDQQTSLVYARVETLDDDVTPYAELVAAFTEFLAELDTRGHTIAASGEPLIAGWILTLSMQDFAVIAPASLLLIVLLTWLIFRRFVAVWTALAVVVVALVGTLGFTALVGDKLNMLNMTLIHILIPICVADCVHILTHFFRHYRREPDGASNGREAAAYSLSTLFVPCSLTTVTTAVGFLALTPSRLQPMRELGYQAAFGVTLTLLVALVALPAVLSMYRGKPRGGGARPSRAASLARWAADATYRFRWPIVGATGVVLVVAASQLGDIRPETRNSDYFKPNSPVRQGMEDLDRILRGAVALELVIDSGHEGGVKEPSFLDKVGELTAWIEARAVGAKPIGLRSYLESINETLALIPHPEKKTAEGEPSYRYVPPDRRMISQMMLAYESLGAAESLRAYVDPTERYTRLPMPLPDMPRTEYEAVVADLTAFVAATVPEYPVEQTGMVMLFTAMDRYILETAHLSFSIALGVVIFCLFLVLRSVRLGLIAIAPNLLPLTVAGALLVAADLRLDFGTTMVAAITFGLIVDDTIHFMTRLRARLREGKSPREAVLLTYQDAGMAIVTTSIIITVGFGLYMMSSFVPNIRFGSLAALVVSLACLVDLIVVPALLYIVYPGDRPRGPAVAGKTLDATGAPLGGDA
jgi:uncharacterized protein